MDVAEGEAVPVSMPANEPGYLVHGRNGFGEIDIPASHRSKHALDAVDYISDASKRFPGEIVLCAVGPLTNLARLLERDPGIVSRLKAVVVMGGAVHRKGNVTPVAEANFWNDPHAADAVLGASWPLVLAPLDCTMPVVFTPDFMQALAVGLETACRIGAWLGRPHYEAGFHQTGTSGAFGATAAAGRILGLSAGQMAEALSLTATRAAGLKSQFGTMGKPLNAGFAAEVGVTCALLAEAGAASTPMAIEGAQGFGPTHAGVADSEALGGLGAEWVFPRISYKFHACCHGLHAMLEALRKVKARGLEPGAIEAVEIRTHPRWLAVCNQPEPVTGLQAKFSYRLTAAMSLTGLDTSALEVYSDATCARDDLIALRDRVRVVADDSVPDTASEVRVTAADRVLNAGHDVLADSNPDVIEPRLRAKSETLLGGNSSASLWEAVGEIEQQGGMTALTTHIGSAAG